MGDRISLQFEAEGYDWQGKPVMERSVVFSSHFRGASLVMDVMRFNDEVLAPRKGGEYPLDRMEPSIVMVAFIAWYFGANGPEHGHIPDSGFYLTPTLDGADNDDNGNLIATLRKQEGLVSIKRG